MIDTNVFITALMSNQGASFKLLSLIDKNLFEFAISVPLILEYEDVAMRNLGVKINLEVQAIEDIINYLCLIGQKYDVFYLWRPFLKDPHDDLVLELAVRSESTYILTYNLKDFEGCSEFGIEVIDPKTFLKIIGVIP